MPLIDCKLNQHFPYFASYLSSNMCAEVSWYLGLPYFNLKNPRDVEASLTGIGPWLLKFEVQGGTTFSFGKNSY